MEKGPGRSYNGVPQPDRWPPRLVYDGGRRPIRVPYLDASPETIPIDVGRQLFIDDFLVESTTLTRRFHQAEKSEHNPVLTPETATEMDGGECPVAAPFNDGVWWDPTDRLFKMWYQAGWMSGTGYAVSDDGIEWSRPALDVVPGTNLVLAPRPGYRRDGCCVWLDHGAEDSERRFKMFQYFRSSGETGRPWSGGEVYTSPDGIHWGEPTRTGPLGDNSSFFYNPFRKKWVYSVRRTEDGVRARRYIEHADFLDGSQWEDEDPVLWAWSDELDEPDPQIGEAPQLYDLNAVAYESVMLGLIAIFRGPPNPEAAERGVPKTNDLTLGFSRDGFHWDRPDRRSFIPATHPGHVGQGIHPCGGRSVPGRRRPALLLLRGLVRRVPEAQGEHGRVPWRVQRHVRGRRHRTCDAEEGRIRVDGRGDGRRRPHHAARHLRRPAPVRQCRHLSGRSESGGAGPTGRCGSAILGRSLPAGLGRSDGAEDRLDGRPRPLLAEGHTGQVQVSLHQRQPVHLLGEPGPRGLQQRLRSRGRARSQRADASLRGVPNEAGAAG